MSKYSSKPLRFRLGETYTTKGGYPARIICVDSSFKSGAYFCPIVALLTIPTNINSAGVLAYHYSEDGKLSGTGNASYDLVSNEPTDEEAEIIMGIRDLMEKRIDDDFAFVKVLRQLRKK